MTDSNLSVSQPATTAIHMHERKSPPTSPSLLPVPDPLLPTPKPKHKSKSKSDMLSPPRQSQLTSPSSSDNDNDNDNDGIVSVRSAQSDGSRNTVLGPKTGISAQPTFHTREGGEALGPPPLLFEWSPKILAAYILFVMFCNLGASLSPSDVCWSIQNILPLD